MFYTREVLEKMRWQDLVSFAFKNGIAAIGEGMNRNTLINLVLEKSNMKKKAIIVGRHTPDLGQEAENIEIVSQEAVTFPTDLIGTIQALETLKSKAFEMNADAVLLQNTPGIVTAGLMYLKNSHQFGTGVFGFRWGIIISVPGERQSGVTETFVFEADGDGVLPGSWSQTNATTAQKAVSFANGRAKTEIRESEKIRGHHGEAVAHELLVTVDPVTPFVFSHIEWL